MTIKAIDNPNGAQTPPSRSEAVIDLDTIEAESCVTCGNTDEPRLFLGGHCERCAGARPCWHGHRTDECLWCVELLT